MIAELITNRVVESFQIGEYSAWIGLSDDFNLRCDSLLRFVGDDGTFITNEDHVHQFGLSEPIDAEAEISKRIQDKIISSVEAKSDTGDLTLRLNGGRLEMLCSSSGYENWTLNGPDGLLIVGYGRGAKDFILGDDGIARET